MQHWDVHQKKGRKAVVSYECVDISATGEMRKFKVVKPVALVEDAILDCSDRKGIVVDAFLPTGPTLIAAESGGRRCFGLELDPKYVDLIIRRWQEISGGKAVLAKSGLEFDTLA